MNKKLPKSLRIYIRKEKGRIRRRPLDEAQKKQLVEDLIKRFHSGNQRHDG